MIINPLFHSLNAWRKCQQFVADAKAAVMPEDRATLQKLAAIWRAEHEMYQAIYWADIRSVL